MADDVGLLPALRRGRRPLYIVGGAHGQAPPAPMLSGPIFAILAAIILIVSARPFVAGRPKPLTRVAD